MKFAVKLAFIFILIGSIPLILGGVFLLNFFNDYLEKTVRDNLIVNAEARAHEAMRFLDQKIERAKKITEKIEIYIIEEEGIGDEEELQEDGDKEKYYIDDSVIDTYDYYSSFENFFILDENGEVVFSKVEDDTIDWGETQWFDEVKTRRQAVVSDIIFNEKRENLKLAIFSPIEHYDNFFVVSEIYIDNFFQIFESGMANDCCVFLVNSEGDIFFSSNKDIVYRRIDANYPLHENFERRRGGVDFYFSGEKNIGGFYVIDGLMWQVILSRPEKDVFAFLQLMTANYFNLIIIILVPIILFSFLISRKIMKPLKNISMASKRIAMGDLEVEAKVRSKDEFGELADNFNKMTKEVKKVRRVIEKEKEELENKVKERTKELKALNDSLEDEVKKRTKDMEQKIIELEKMSKLMIGRESKMIELKKKIKEMESYIEKIKRENS